MNLLSSVANRAAKIEYCFTIFIQFLSQTNFVFYLGSLEISFNGFIGYLFDCKKKSMLTDVDVETQDYKRT